MLTAAGAAILLLLLLGLCGPLHGRLPGSAARTDRIAYGGGMAGCFVLMSVGLAALSGAVEDDALSAALPIGLPWLGAHFRLDPLSAFFMVVVDLGGLIACIYGLGYGTHEREPGRVLGFFTPYLAGLNLVLLADDAFSFLLCWEFMSLSSWLLVLVSHRDPENRHAAYVYIVMASIGTFCLLLAFGLMAGPGGGYGFAAMRASALDPGLETVVLLLAIAGAGSKAGLVPLHAWLPLAHPAAPSHVSALMSGVMTKVAIYGFVRIVLDLLGTPAWWWGLVVLLLGGLTAAMGVLYALMQQDLKRLLAYSTVENVGLVFVGLGLALAFQAQGMVVPAALALSAGLLHVLNHSLFKSLLFFGAGAVLVATGERQLDRLGGLIHRMPRTAILFLVGCAAISALPPLNGFVSEWLIFQAILLSPQLPDWALRFVVPAVGAVLALSAALVATTFVKAYGIAFLGRPRSREAEAAHEVDRWQGAAMTGLAALCLAVGVLPALFLDLLAPVTQALTGASLDRQSGLPWLTLIPIAEARSSYNGLLLLLFIAFSTVVPALVIHRFATRATRRGAIWDCGFPQTDPATQYTSGSFAQPLRRVFGTLIFHARERVDMPLPGEVRAARFSVELRDLAWDVFYAPVARAVEFAAGRLNHLQFLTVRRYLSLVFGALVLLLLVLAIWQ
ncbi:MAG: hydrogenase 4 subunit B [Alphaproteobacteria bacterium]|nr:hydrogenase 4 subunit B [Alphaproteobacteria bacterium]